MTRHSLDDAVTSLQQVMWQLATHTPDTLAQWLSEVDDDVLGLAAEAAALVTRAVGDEDIRRRFAAILRRVADAPVGAVAEPENVEEEGQQGGSWPEVDPVEQPVPVAGEALDQPAPEPSALGGPAESTAIVAPVAPASPASVAAETAPAGEGSAPCGQP